MAFEKMIEDRFRDALKKLAEAGKIELVQQGHKATGKLVNSIEEKVVEATLDKLVGVIYSEDYYIYVNDGVKASRVPFSGSRGSSSNQTSKYIEGLLRWAQVVKPGLNEKERKSFVFAVANTHRKEGIPTSGSFSYSKNGRRTAWIRYGFEEYVPVLENNLRLFDLLEAILTEQVNDAMK
jgi:hypothetical protein